MPNSIDYHPERLWKWRQSQFLAGLIHPLELGPTPPISLNTRIALNSEEAKPYLTEGWLGVEQELRGARQHYRWTEGDQARIEFHIDKTESLLFKIRLTPFVIKDKHERQRISVRLNDNELIGMVLMGTPWGEMQWVEMQWVLPAALLRQNNSLDFIFKDAESSYNLKLNDDRRKLGMAVVWFELNQVKQ